MRRLVLAVCVIAAFLIAPAARVARSHPAPQVIDLIWTHVGGKDLYKSARFLRFTWGVEREGRLGVSRRHTWDRYTGDYVLGMKHPKTGDEIEVYFNVNTKKGVAVRNGEVVAGGEESALIEDAYGAFINDTYWLLAPVKLDDYGVRVAYQGHEGDGVEADQFIVLHVFFEDVGLTPKDQYWLYVTHDGRVARWRYVLESGREGEWTWSEEKDCGMGLTFSTRKTSADGKSAIVFPEVVFSTAMDRRVFEYHPAVR